MNSLLCLCFTLFCISNVIGATLNAQEAEDLCLKRYKSGNEFDMKNALGEWHSLYFWPPLVHGQQENCGKFTFKQVAASDIKCSEKVEIPTNETIYEMKYANDIFEVVRLLYGAGDAKTLVECSKKFGGKPLEVDNPPFKEVNPQRREVHSDLGNGKLLVVICPDGMAALISRNLISASELESTVEGVDVMKGIDGAPECKLP